MLKETFEAKLKKVKPEKMDMPESSEYYPSVHFDSKTLPEIKDWKVGEEYVVVVKAKMKSYSEHKEGADASFDIVEIGVLDKEVDDKDDEGDMETSKAKLKKKYLG